MTFTVMQGKISKGNSTGTGWLTLPSHLRGTVSPSKWYDLIKFSECNHDIFEIYGVYSITCREIRKKDYFYNCPMSLS
ncbi:hypothetical protein ES704_02420 [subsurface metagenome]|jgi:hypothetical protein